MSESTTRKGRKDSFARSILNLTRVSQRNAGCKLAGYLVQEDDDALYIADPQGTWILPRDSYEDLESWVGGIDAPATLGATGRPVSVTLKENAQIHEVRTYTVRKGGDPIAAAKNRELVRRIFSLDGDLPDSEVGLAGERRLLALEEAFGRRMGWDPMKPVGEQLFFDHHLRSASWSCEGDGGGSCD